MADSKIEELRQRGEILDKALATVNAATTNLLAARLALKDVQFSDEAQIDLHNADKILVDAERKLVWLRYLTAKDISRASKEH